MTPLEMALAAVAQAKAEGAAQIDLETIADAVANDCGRHIYRPQQTMHTDGWRDFIMLDGIGAFSVERMQRVYRTTPTVIINNIAGIGPGRNVSSLTKRIGREKYDAMTDSQRIDRKSLFF